MDSSVTGAQAATATDRAARRAHLRPVTASVIRICVLTGLLVWFFATAPLDPRPERATVIQLVVSLLALGVVVTWQIIAVARSPFPGLRAVEALTISVLLLLVIFASAYFVTGRANPASFSEPISRFDAMYFTVTVFATVGFGDIAAKTDAARIAVTVQMIANMVLIGVIARVLLGAAQQRRQALTTMAAEAREVTGTPPEERG